MSRPLLIGSLLLLPSLLSAQRHAAVVPRLSPAPVAATSVHLGAVSRTVPAPVAPFRHSLNRPSVASPRRPSPSHSRIAPASMDLSNSFVGFDDAQVPGLGFDYVHFAATHPQGSHRRNRENGFITPLFGSAFYPFYSVADEATQPAVEPQTDDSQYDQPPPMRRQHSTQLAEVSAPTEQRPAYPLSDSDEYVFVRRDGTVFFAVAYTWDLNTLRYITSQGLRQSISSDALDLDATHQFNEQRGLTFRSPT